MKTREIYIYGIGPNLYNEETTILLEKSGIYSIPYLNISAIVSDWESEIPDHSDKESIVHLLIHHQKTIENLMDKGFTTMIPMKLGTIVSSKEEILKILASGHDLIIDILKKIEHLTEIDIAVTWADFSGILKEIAIHPDIVAIKDKILKNSHTILQIDQVKMGMMLQLKLKEKNSKVELNILDSLASVSLDIKTHEVMNEEMITNSAFLINRNKREKFEQIVELLDEEYKGLLKFKLIGPLPCYSFYTLEVKALNPEKVVQAKKELELKEETSELEIKKAYLGKARLSHPDAQMGNGEKEKFNNINKAYHTLLEYSAAARQSSKENLFSLAKEKVTENLILVKIKE